MRQALKDLRSSGTMANQIESESFFASSRDDGLDGELGATRSRNPDLQGDQDFFEVGSTSDHSLGSVNSSKLRFKNTVDVIDQHSTASNGMRKRGKQRVRAAQYQGAVALNSVKEEHEGDEVSSHASQRDENVS